MQRTWRAIFTDGFAGLGRLQAEQALDLVPDRQTEDDGHEDERDQRDVEAQSRLPRAAAAFHARPPFRPVEAIRGANGLGGVDRGVTSAGVTSRKRWGRRLRAQAWKVSLP